MFFSKLVTVMISPLGSALIAWALTIVLIVLGRRSMSLVCALAGLLWLLLWSLPVVTGVLVQVVERPYSAQALADIPAAPAMVVLGGGINASGHDDETGQAIELNEASERVWFASRLFHAGKAPLMVMTGSGVTGTEALSEAEAMGMLARDLRVPEMALVMETSSRNTRENALFTASLLARRQITTVVLVTSASHMARAVHHFEAEGLTVYPAPTDFRVAQMARKPCCLPDGEALAVSGHVFKELLGQLVWR